MFCDNIWFATGGGASKLLASSVDIKPDNNSIAPKHLYSKKFPNPFKKTTTISFHIPLRQKVSVSIYSINGKPVKKLIDKYLAGDNHSVVFNGNEVSAGSYICGIKTEKSGVVYKKLFLVK